jgi:hypothetical protein
MGTVGTPNLMGNIIGSLATNGHILCAPIFKDTQKERGTIAKGYNSTLVAFEILLITNAGFSVVRTN